MRPLAAPRSWACRTGSHVSCLYASYTRGREAGKLTAAYCYCRCHRTEPDEAVNRAEAEGHDLTGPRP